MSERIKNIERFRSLLIIPYEEGAAKKKYMCIVFINIFSVIYYYL